MLEVRLIGKFDLQCDGKPITISSRAAQSLFANLILTAGTLHRREKLAGMFWPDATEEKARAYLRHELWRIRKALSPKSKVDYLLADDIHISFNVSAAYWLDVATLTNMEEGASPEELMESLAVYQGEFLPGFYDDWALAEREHLQSVYEQKITRLLELLESEKRWREILNWAEKWISFGQAPEAAYRALMVAYDALGDHAKVAATYDRCAQALGMLGLEPSEQTRALVSRRRSKINIPIPLTSFIGREKEFKEVAQLFSKSRLVTLTGSGGVGKTRLAIQVVADVLDRFPDGIWFLDLAPLSDPTLVPTTLTNLLGLRESGELPATELLINYFRSRRALVIFDNCEHLIEVCAQLAYSLLTSCEKLSILTTSREALRVSGEIPYRVPSLEIPKTGVELDTEKLLAIESGKLFVERAVVTYPDFIISPQSVRVIAQICRRLDGIPLAIELAATLVNVLTVEQISKRLEDRFNLLTGGLRSALPRHQTLRAMIEWSYDLLSEKEQLLFRRLAVFVGGWTLEAAEKVCSEDRIQSQDVIDLLSQLVNKSLVTVETVQGEIRYRRLETIRQYASEKLVESEERDKLRDRHLEYFLKLAETAEPHLIRAEQLEWLPLLDADYENLRLAFEWALSKESAESSLNLCKALGWFWEIRCYWLEGLNWSKRALAKRSQDKNIKEKIARARAFYTCALLELQLSHIAQMRISAEASLALASENANERDIAIAEYFFAVALLQHGYDDDWAFSLLEQCFARFLELNEPFWQARAFSPLGGVLITQAKLNFHDQLLQCIELARKAGERLTLADALSNYADWLLRMDREEEAREYAEESDRLYQQIGSEKTSLNSFLFAEIAWSNGDYEKARSLLMELYQRFSLLGEKGFKSNSAGKLGLLMMEEGDLHPARAYLEEALAIEREAGWKPWEAFYLTELGNLLYQEGKVEEFKQNIRESLSLRNYFPEYHKTYILMTILGSIYFRNPESSASLLGIIDSHEGEFNYPRSAVEKRYCRLAETRARELLGDIAFESEFVKGQKMSLDEGLDLALKTVEEM
jgi:predicted ATPase/DNA-binding SARP family transcriptional activator